MKHPRLPWWAAVLAAPVALLGLLALPLYLAHRMRGQPPRLLSKRPRLSEELRAQGVIREDEDHIDFGAAA